MKRPVVWAFGAALLFVAAAVIAPYIRVDTYREQIREGLQRSLRRKVEINGDTRLNLLRGPGFSVQQVVIHDDPKFGLEPLASVPEIQARVSLLSLWSGRLEFATVRFIEPSVNLARVEGDGWNIAALAQSALASNEVTEVPEIHVSDGRIDFKIDNLKSRFYLTDTDLTISPSRDGVDINFSGAPARTDRVAGGYGLFSGRGRWSAGKIDLDVRLEESPVEDFVTLARGRSLGLHGTIAGRARVSGEALKPTVRGRFELRDVHRWNMMEAHGGSWSMNFRGRADLFGQHVEFEAAPADNANTPLSLRLLVSSVLTQPEWRVEMSTSAIPASWLLLAARNLGTPLPDGVVAEGKAAGTLAYSSSDGMQGQLQVENGTVALRDGSSFSLPSATVLVSGDEVRLGPALLADAGSSVQLEGAYAPFRDAFTLRLTGRNLKLAALAGSSEFSLTRNFEGGLWTGSVEYSDNVWSADLSVRDAVARVPGLAPPLRIRNARVQLNRGGLSVRQMHFRCGEVEGFGHYRYVVGDVRPHRFDVSVPQADTAEIERLLMPALRPESGLLARTLRWRAALPQWLRDRSAAGTIRVGALTAGGVQLRGFQTRVEWDGPVVRLKDVRARIQEAALTGTVIADLRDREPKYKLEGRIRQLPWNSGNVHLDGELTTAGIGTELLSQLKADGRFQAEAVSMLPDMPSGSASGEFEMSVSRSGQHWKLIAVEAAVGSERFQGEGGTAADGRIELELKSPARTLSVHLDRSASKVTP